MTEESLRAELEKKQSALNELFGRIQEQDWKIQKLGEERRALLKENARLRRHCSRQGETVSQAQHEKVAYDQALVTIHIALNDLRMALEDMMQAQNLESAQEKAQEAMKRYDSILDVAQNTKVRAAQEQILWHIYKLPSLGDEERKLLSRFFADHAPHLLTVDAEDSNEERKETPTPKGEAD